MMHTCPQCGSHRVKHTTRAVGRHFLRSAYRCRRCNAQFWAIASATWVRIGLVGFVLLMGSILSAAWVSYDRYGDAIEVAAKIESARKKDGTDDYRIAQKHLKGDGVPLDTGEGVLWLERSAQQGYAKAQYELAVA